MMLHASTELNKDEAAAAASNDQIEPLETGGVAMDDLLAGETLCIVTKNRQYRLLNLGGGEGLLSGHPAFCPHPVTVRVNGSTWGDSMVQSGYLGIGMRLEFHLTDSDATVRTSPVRSIQRLADRDD